MQDQVTNALEQLSHEHIGGLDAQQVINAISCLPAKKAKGHMSWIILDKSHRPKNLVEQYWLLRWIGDQACLDPELQFYAKIAASYKSLESSLDVEVQSMVSEIMLVIDGCPMLNRSDNVREDRVQLTFSALTVLWHLHLFLGMREEFFQVGERSVRILEEIDDSQIGRSFYATCTNIARCMAVAYLSGVHKGDNKLREASIRELAKAFKLGIDNSFDHPRVFDEFIESTKIYHEMVDLQTQNTLGSCPVSGESLLRFAVRPEYPEKVTRLLEKFREFESELMQPWPRPIFRPRALLDWLSRKH